MASFDFFAPCPRGLEAALATELREIAQHAALDAPLRVGTEVHGGVHFSGSLTAAMAVNLYSRIANRVLLRLAQRAYLNEHDIFAFALEQQWERWFTARETLRVDVTAIHSKLTSLSFTALRVKDAICDRLREKLGVRPSVDTAMPDVRIFVFLTETECSLYIDTSGEPLFKRGWRLDKGAAPLRENLAAGILRLTGWQPEMPLYDPMCGSGTFLAEAAQIALKIAPGVQRWFAFEKLKPYNAAAWKKLKAAALEEQQAARSLEHELAIFGSDISNDMLTAARANFVRAGLPALPLKQLDARSMTPPIDKPGIVLINPPYGERIEVRGRNSRGKVFTVKDEAAKKFHRDQPDMADAEFFSAFGDALKQRFTGWRAFVLTSDRSLPGQMRLREAQKTPLYNGSLECRLFRFDLIAGSLRRRAPDTEPNQTES